MQGRKARAMPEILRCLLTCLNSLQGNELNRVARAAGCAGAGFGPRIYNPLQPRLSDVPRGGKCKLAAPQPCAAETRRHVVLASPARRFPRPCTSPATESRRWNASLHGHSRYRRPTLGPRLSKAGLLQACQTRCAYNSGSATRPGGTYDATTASQCSRARTLSPIRRTLLLCILSLPLVSSP